MGPSPKASPSKRIRQDKSSSDVRDRLQAASKSSDSRRQPTNRSNDSHRSSGRDRSRNDKHSSGRDSSMERVMERARAEGGSKWTKRLLDEEAKDPDRWGHSGFKEMYKTELGISKNSSRRSRSRDRANIQVRVVRRSKSRDRSNNKRPPVADRRSSNNRSRKRSHSSSDRTGNKKRPNASSNNGKTHIKQERLSPAKRDRNAGRSRPSGTAKSRRGPSSPPERFRSRSASTPSPRLRGGKKRDSSSSTSWSRTSSSSSSSSSIDSSSSDGLAIERVRKPRLPDKPRPDISAHGRVRVKQEMPKGNKSKSKRRRSRSSNSESTSSSEEEEMEEGEYGGASGGPEIVSEPKAEPSATRLSLSERFGKLAQLAASSQRRNLNQNLVQLKIVTPVTGAGQGEKNVSVDEKGTIPIISGTRASLMSSRLSDPLPRQSNVVPHHPLPPNPNMPPADDIIPRLKQDDRTREEINQWGDWHDSYQKYRRIKPPRIRPRDWDDVRVRHKYYTDKGYFGHDMTLDELMRWEEWWERYLEWRAGYKRAWIETHGPHVPVEFPGTVYEPIPSDYQHLPNMGGGGGNKHQREREPPPVMHHPHHPAALPFGQGPMMSSSSNVRSRLGWRR